MFLYHLSLYFSVSLDLIPPSLCLSLSLSLSACLSLSTCLSLSLPVSLSFTPFLSLSASLSLSCLSVFMFVYLPICLHLYSSLSLLSLSLTYDTDKSRVESILNGSGGFAVGKNQRGNIMVEKTVCIEHHIQEKPTAGRA